MIFAVALVADASQSLDGPWEIVFDPENRGRAENWHKEEVFSKLDARREIQVPSCWEEIEQDYEGVAWFRRDFEAPAGWKGRHVRLHFDAVNYRAELWINGEVIGMHEGGYGPFEFDITGNLEFGESNTAVVRVVGPAIVSDQVDDLVRNATPHWRGGYVGGIWQPVKLLVTDPLHLADVFVLPSLESKEAKVEIRVANASTKTRKVILDVSVAPADDADKPLAAAQLKIAVPPGGLKKAVTLSIPEAVAWSPENPYLYRLRAELSESEKPVDVLDTRFGMRSFTIEDGDFLLNGKKIFIKGAFWEGQYPNTLAVPRDLDMVRREIRLAKEAGFNMLRPWRMPPAPAILDLCDEMGMLLSGAPAVENMGYWPEETPLMEKRWTDDFVAMVKRDRNHPSIVLWETANEIIRKSNLLPRHRISLAARAEDPTRLIIDESGGSRAPWGSHAYLPYLSEPVPMIDRHIYRRAPVDHDTYHHLATVGEADQATLISEVGYGGAPDFADNARRYRQEGNPKAPDYRFHLRMLESLDRLMDRHELRGMFPDASALCLATQKLQAEGNKLQLEALRINPKVDGYCLHAYTDGNWVIGAGVLDLWRRPKLLYAACAEVQQPLYLAVRAEPQNVYAEQGTKLTITAVNEGRERAGQLEVALSGTGEPRRVLISEFRTVTPGIQRLCELQLDTKGLAGEFTVTANLGSEADAATATNTFPILVLRRDDLSPPEGAVALIDPKRELGVFLEKQGVACREFDEETAIAIPVIVTQPEVWNENEKRRIVDLLEWVGRGGRAIWLRPPVIEEYHGQPIYRDPVKNYMMKLRGQTEPWRLASSSLIREDIFPFPLRSRPAAGNWIPVGHYARKHPVFDGLPSGGLMGQPYQNVAATQTIVNLPDDAEEIAGSVSWDILRDYRGPTDWWHGTDLAAVRHGRGRMILSMLKVAENLGKDPVADRLLFNLIRFAGNEDPS